MTDVVLTEGERVRRRELQRDTRAALKMGLTYNEFIAKRDKATEDWCAWLHAEMDRTRANDPTEILPEICVRIEQRAIAAAHRTAETAARNMVAAMLRKAIT